MLSLRARAGRLIVLLVLGAALLIGSSHTLRAGGPGLHPSQGPRPSVGHGHPGLPGSGRPLYSPPPFIDHAPPMSERPFAQPFIDRGPSFADRPLAPIGGGAFVAPGPMP